MKTLLCALAVLAILKLAAPAAALGITLDSGLKTLQDENGAALTAGVLATARDGAQILLGYYPTATLAAPFGPAGTTNQSFVRLTGPGAPFAVNFTIGDLPLNGANAGQLYVDTFSINTGVADAILPPVGMPLVLRVFNRPSEGASTFLTELANPAIWKWVLPATPPSGLNMNLDDPGLSKRAVGSRTGTPVSGTTFAIRTDEAVPEPCSALLALSGLALLGGRRRKV